MRNKWSLFVKLGVLLTSLFVIFVINTKNTSASDFNGVTEHKITSASLSNGSQAVINFDTGASFVGTSQSTTADGWISNLNISLGTTIPSNSYFYITGSYYYATGNPDSVVDFRGFSTSSNFIILDSQVTDVSGDRANSVQFSYLVYTSVATNSIIFGNNNMFYWLNGYTSLNLSHVISVNLSRSPSSEQLNSVLQYLQYQDDQNNSTNNFLQRIITYLQYQDDQNNETNDILYEIRDLLEAQDQNSVQEQEDRDNIEEQSSDAQGGADSSQQQAESTGSTLLSAFTAFVGALTNANPSNCNIDMDMGNLDLGVVNFCQLSPPPGFTTLSSIFLILFCVPLSIATGRKVINLFRSFQR